MSVRSAQSIVVEFITSNPTTMAAVNADSLPAGILVLNGTDNGATVTVTNVDAGRYKAAVTLPTLAAGDVVELSIAATVAAVAGKAIVWRDTKDVLLDSSGGVTFSNTSIATVATTTNLTNLPTIPANWLTAAGLATDAAVEIAGKVLDEVNTAAIHNINSSLGKQIRAISPNAGVIYGPATAPSQAGMSATQIKLDAGASSTSNVYRYNVISITAGTDAGDSAVIVAYDGGTKVATVDEAWAVQPDNTSVFEISPGAKALVIDKTGFALSSTGADLATPSIAAAIQDAFCTASDSVQASPAPTATAFAGSSALSSVDDFYGGSVLFFTSGALDGVARKVAGYTGATRLFAFTAGFPAVPAAAVTFRIIGRID